MSVLLLLVFLMTGTGIIPGNDFHYKVEMKFQYLLIQSGHFQILLKRKINIIQNMTASLIGFSKVPIKIINFRR